MEENNIKQQKVIKISKKKFLILIAIVIVALVVWHENKGQVYYMYDDADYGAGKMEETPAQTVSNESMDISGRGYERSISYPEPVPPFYDRDVDITDTREFLKTSYSSHIYSKDVKDTVDRVEYAIRSVDGRIDNLSSTERYGSISFVIAKSDLSEFRDEIEKITHAKLYIETISSRNLLSEKQDIEARTEDTIETLDEAEQSKQVLDQSHKEKIDYWTAQILALQEQMNDDLWYEKMGSAMNDSSEEEVNQAVLDEKQKLMEQIIALQQKQKVENINYAYQNKNLVNQINNLGGNLEVLEEEDVDFMNDIETVEGRVSVEWISCWEKYDMLSPTPMWLNTGVAIVIIWWFLYWRKIIPKIQLV